MHIDKDSQGFITISEMTADEATVLQIAMISLADQQIDSPSSLFLRRTAMVLDKLLQP